VKFMAPSTVIIGSGIIGLCTAYYLSEVGNADPESVCVVDTSGELFCCASGFAGGFLVGDCEFHFGRVFGLADFTLSHDRDKPRTTKMTSNENT